MKIVKSFEEFVKEGVVNKVSIDKQRIDNFLLEAERKSSLLRKTIENLGINDENANDYVEMFLIRANMLARGFTSSGYGAHEAEVAFARNMGLNESRVLFLDQLRYFRNCILYYGKRFDREYAEKVVNFTNKMYSLLRKMPKRNNFL